MKASSCAECRTSETAPESESELHRVGGAQDADLHLRLELRGTHDTASVMKWLRKKLEVEESTMTVVQTTDENDEPITFIEVRVPIDDETREHLTELKANLTEALPDVQLPTGARIEIKGPDD